MKYQFISEHEKAWPIWLMCKVLDVSRSGYYDWKTRDESRQQRERRKLLVAIKAAHSESRENYGSPRIHAALTTQGHKCSKNRVARLMSEHGIRAKTKRKFKATTDSKHRYPVAANLLKRDFQIDETDKVWLTDITYIWTKEGWLYLAAIMDLCSRRIVGWALESRMTKEFACRALKMAYDRRRPGMGLIHHSDRGSQYASHDYQALLDAYNMKCSMSRKGDCWDNAPMESFFHTLKTELVHHRDYQNRIQARTEIIEYIEMFYNGERLHSALGYTSPVKFETMHLKKVA